MDILGQRLHRFAPQGLATTSWELPETIGTVAPRQSGGLILALGNDVVAFDPATGELQHLATIESDPRTRLNDGKCDPRGRFWVGSMDIEEQKSIGALYCMDANGKVQQWADSVGVSNGMTWSPDERRMYYIDSPTRCVDVFDMEPDSGVLSKRRTLFSFEEDEGFPDGMTSDARGNLWIAHWGGARVTQRDGQSGKPLAVYKTKAWQTSACCFGGAELDALFVTTARVGLTEEQQSAFPDSGHLLRLKTNVRGTPTHAYAG